MTLDEFWQHIDAWRASAGEDREGQIAPMYDLLEQLNANELVSFERHLRACVKAAKRTDIYAAITIIDGCWVPAVWAKFHRE
jgi:hypothetical protein